MESYPSAKSRCKSSENSLVFPTQCIRHSVGTTCTDMEFMFDPKFVYRDGVMVPIDSNKEVSFHCKLKTLCLRSLRVYLHVHDACHMVPMDQPKAALEMLKLWTRGTLSEAADLEKLAAEI
ncbi:Uncharacterized protein TCM_043304 [Theobroma cacao]|uniref:Uncharacterized protein n=1 Tax=Theobroma cacao TaxID=3641 RepID=A0A061FP22_THECC|nr:Uncharacterized protein TCM_043304 [Theobroma cacao]